jgi:hypothetical protein
VPVLRLRQAFWLLAVGRPYLAVQLYFLGPALLPLLFFALHLRISKKWLRPFIYYINNTILHQSTKNTTQLDGRYLFEVPPILKK